MKECKFGKKPDPFYNRCDDWKGKQGMVSTPTGQNMCEFCIYYIPVKTLRG